MLKLDLQFFASGDFITDIPEKPEPPGFVLYNGESIYFAAGETLTLHCAGRKMKTDLSACFVSAGTVTYNGKEIAVASGETVNLSCAGKKMKSDIVIAVPEAANSYNITASLFGCTGNSTNPTEIGEGETLQLYFTPNDGYSLPVSVYVSGAEYYWIWSGGYLEIKNPTGPVYISISAIVNDGSACPACGSTDIGKSEFIGDSGPMYLCNACGHVFEAIVSPPILE